ncbi:uncharacterized protein MELLADRAFT_96427 [Melampsora larici-populina 98AG31]|uniref:Uncharacterized protein n=1 Tax=Melampsora larici-populina (strain 98AG31 / pathotype 3-4-7) TaxID=747676 RepID=F4RET0_MELLP|nr:uncharacterized protein MELLADRAFT_96427 [Melampsora larici-populina 98AG31]EGG09153.1 hypothetical protein MELLADRAFT_96427 [Melampsora larici-populina 98AG31]
MAPRLRICLNFQEVQQERSLREETGRAQAQGILEESSFLTQTSKTFSDPMQVPANITHVNSSFPSPTFKPFCDELHIPSITFEDFLNDPEKIPQLPGYEEESDPEHSIHSEEHLESPQQICSVLYSSSPKDAQDLKQGASEAQVWPKKSLQSSLSPGAWHIWTPASRFFAGGILILNMFLCLYIKLHLLNTFVNVLDYRLAPNTIPWHRETHLLTRLRQGMDSDEITSVQHTSENIVKSMKELCLEMDRQAIDTLPLQEISSLLRLQPNLRGSFETSVILWDLSDAVNLVGDKLRQLHGKGHTEMGLLTQESKVLLNQPHLPSKLQIPQEMLDQTLYIFTLLQNIANSIIKEIRLTTEANQVAKQNLSGIERTLRASLNSWSISYFSGSSKYRASGLLLNSIRLAITHTGEIATYLQKVRRMIQLYHDNAQSWLDMAQRRNEPFRNSVDGSAMQCLLLLNTLDEHIWNGQVEKPLLGTTRNPV